MSEMKQIDQLWILPTEAGYKIGLTAEAQEDLGKITFATFPKVGQTLAKGDSLIELEAEKAVSEFSSPLSGKVVAINEAADQEPSALDEENAWITVLADVEPTEFENL